MAKDIKVIKGEDKIIINETQIENFEKLGYKQVNKQDKPKINKEKKAWQPITEKKV